MLKYVAPLIAVDEIARSRSFYEQLLGQRVKFDFGENVVFEGDFSIHLKPHFQSLLGEATQYPVTRKAHWGEMYFETDDLASFQQRLEQAGVEFIHPVHEQPWGQRVMRVYDPDGHIVELGETMEAVVWRFHQQGLAIERISERSGMSGEFIEQAIRERSEPGQPDGG